jgi:hypothetical protein
MPVGGHALPVCFAVLGHCLAVMSNELLTHVDKDNVWLMEMTLLEGGAYLQ